MIVVAFVNMVVVRGGVLVLESVVWIGFGLVVITGVLVIVSGVSEMIVWPL